MHPRRSRLGLIEAPTDIVNQAIMLSIRGVRASASLKLCETPCSCGRISGIRGVRASASLKRNHPARRNIPRRRIRGVRASASLKQRSLDRIEGRLDVHPRRSRLGLIEARAD